MSRLLFIFLIVSGSLCKAQSYEEVVDKCTKEFQHGLDPNNIKGMDSRIVEQIDQLRKCIIGLKFPSFKSTAIDNTTYTLDSLKSRIVLINLWSIGCQPCVAEMPMFNELQNEFSRRDFTILSFGLDDSKSIADFIQKRPLGFSVFASSKELITKKFKMSFGYPTNIFLDQDGRIIDFRIGGALDEVGVKKTKDEFKNLIEKELSK